VPARQAILSEERFRAAPTFHDYLETVRKNEDFWRAVYRMASVHATVATAGWPPGCRLLVLSEDWCGDAVNAVPVVARLAETLGLEMRVAARDANPDLMDGHLTSGTRSIPVVLALDEALVRWSWWGPRPSVLQRWVRSVGLCLPKEERYRRARAWYARDHGRTMVDEILDMLARAGRRFRESTPDWRGGAKLH
jgi:Thioredoxin